MTNVVSLRAVLHMYLGTVLVSLSDSALLMRVHEYGLRGVTLHEVQERLAWLCNAGNVVQKDGGYILKL